MNPMPRAIAGDWLRRPLPLLGFIALVAVTVYKAANYVIAGDMTSLAYVALLSIGSAFVVAMLNSWQKGLYFFLTWLLFEDFARKYLGNNMAIYFAKDVLALVVYLAFFLAYRRKQVTSFRPPFLLPVLLFVWFGVMQVFNPASTNLVYGILGLKLFFYYVPLLFVGYALLNSEQQLRHFFFVNMILVIVIASLGIVLVFAVAFVWRAPWRQREVIRVLRTFQRAPLGIALGLVLLFFVFPETLLSRVAFYQETLLPGSGPGALQFRTWDYPIMNFLGVFGYERSPYGYCIGTLSLVRQCIARFFGSKPPVIRVHPGF